MNQTLASSGFNLAHYWAQGDAVSHAVAYALLLMSIASWYYILSKAWSSWRIRKSAGALEGFWKASSLNDAIAVVRHADTRMSTRRWPPRRAAGGQFPARETP